MKRCRKLTRTEKKAIWSGPTTNAGAGWRVMRPQQHYVPLSLKFREDNRQGLMGKFNDRIRWSKDQ